MSLKSVRLRLLFTICCIFCGSLIAFSQNRQDRASKKAEELYNEGLRVAADGDIRKGIEILSNATKLNDRFAQAYLSLAGMYAEVKDYSSSVLYYQKTRSIDSTLFTDYSLPYSIAQAGMGHFDTALAAIENFLTIPGLNESSRKAAEYRKQCYSFALAYAKSQPLAGYHFEPKNMGDSINSAVSEYFPTLTIDSRELIYTRRVGNVNEDFFEAKKTGTEWTASTALSGEINTSQNEGAQNISQDGQWLIFTGCEFPGGFGSCDLYISYHTDRGWSKAENLGPNINTEAWESAPSLSPDKRDLYFASTREGGYGKSDIYVSHRQADAGWSSPENLGPRVNSRGNESCPFIHADNQTLYFTSDGRPGYGGDDLYMTRKLINDWGAAVNLGYPINTIENEGSMVVSADGGTAYYASDRSDSRGGLDLYTFELRQDARPLKTLWVSGKVFDAKTKQGLPSSVELTELATRAVVSSLQTDEKGNYLVTLPVGKDYAFNVNRKGYLFFSDNFSLADPRADSTYHLDIPLEPLKENASVILKNIFFDVNEFALKSESFIELDKVVALLRDNPSIKIAIHGHTDNTGNRNDNVNLSNNRAKSVVQYLVSKGIAAARLSAKGFGDSAPIADNGTEQGRARNRRTEMQVVH